MGGPKGKGKGMQVKNKEASQQQITAEQIIREAAGREVDARARAPVQRIVDEAELQDYRVRKRKEFEDVLRRQQHNMGTFLKKKHFFQHLSTKNSKTKQNKKGVKTENID